MKLSNNFLQQFLNRIINIDINELISVHYQDFLKHCPKRLLPELDESFHFPAGLFNQENNFLDFETEINFFRYLCYIETQKYDVFYFSYFFSQLNQALFKFDEYITSLKQNSPPEIIFSQIHDFLNRANLITKFLQNGDKSLRKVYLEHFFDKSLLEKQNNGILYEINLLRNHFEHFDERLDTWLNNSFLIPTTGIDNCIYNFPPQEEILARSIRILDASNHIYYFLGDEFDLVKIYDSLEQLLHIFDYK